MRSNPQKLNQARQSRLKKKQGEKTDKKAKKSQTPTQGENDRGTDTTLRPPSLK